MREIKFRAWDKKIQQFIDAKEIVINDGKVFRNWRDYEDYIPDDNTIELVWFTGLVDKDGVGIFDGDIVRCFSHSLSKVEVKKGCFGLTSDGLHEPYFAPFSDIYGYSEILGNIYENPELLEVNK